MTNATLQDDFEISRLMNGWTYRDIARWDDLRQLFHPDGIIEIAWFKGLFSDFVDASIKMEGSKIRGKHVMGKPIIDIQGDRAVAETSAIIAAVNNDIQIGYTAYSRFYDLLEKRKGVWKISRRNNIYDMSFFSFPTGHAEVDQERVKRHPWEYAALAYVIEASGYPVTGTYPTRNSALEAQLRDRGAQWLEG